MAVLKLVIAAIVLAHGIGHILFLAPSLRLANWADQTGHSWLVTPLLGDGLTRAIGAVIWSAAIVLFVGAVVGFFVGAEWWRTTAILGAIVSAVGIIAMWDGLPASSAFLALVFDIVVLIALLWANWPSAETVGS